MSMRQRTHVVAVAAFLGLAAVVPASGAADRADWGVVISGDARTGNGALLVENDRGFALVAVGPSTRLFGPRLERRRLDSLRPGDRIDYAVSTWASLNVVDVIHVTPRRSLAASLRITTIK